MNRFCIKIADVVGDITTIHARPFAVCRRFIVDAEKADYSIINTQADVEKDLCITESISQQSMWEGAVEVYTLLRKVSESLINFDTLLMHGAVVALNGKSYLFTGKSGVGKTTHIRQWLKHFPDAFVVNGDKPFIKINNNGSPFACGSPWAGKENMYTNAIVPLQAIVMIERADENKIFEVPLTKSFPFLLEQTYRYENEDNIRKSIKLIQKLYSDVPVWKFECNNFKNDCFDTAFNALVDN